MKKKHIKSINIKHCILTIIILIIVIIIALNNETNKFNKFIMDSQVQNFEGTNFITSNLEKLQEGQLYAGYSKVSINPDPNNGPIPLAGYGNTYNRLATFNEGDQKYQQDIYATAVAIMDENQNIVIFVTMDLIESAAMINYGIRDRIAEATNISYERIMISATHTHSAPDIAFSNSSYPELVNTIKEYKELVTNQVIVACQNAISDLKPSDISINSIDIVREDGKNALNFVRHYETDGYYEDETEVYTGDNHGSFYWDGDSAKIPTKTNHATVADATMQLIKFKTNNKDILMVNWQAHPLITGGAANHTISADFIAGFREIIEKTYNCKVAYYTGAAGNLNNYTQITDGSEGIEKISYSQDKATEELAHNTSIKFGEKLASYVTKEYNNFEKVNGNKVNVLEEKISLNMKTETNTNLITNAKYCQKIWNSDLATVARMIEGKYIWGDSYVFPKINNNKDTIDNTGSFLRKCVSQSDTLRNAFIISGNDQNGYSCTVSGSANVSVKNILIAIVGAKFEDRIYSPYHANVVIGNSEYKKGQTKEIPISTVSIGDISFATAPYEMFDTNAQYIKNNSDSKMTFILEITNGGYGYFPSEKAFDYGCYEADTARYEKGSAEKIATKLVSMLGIVNDNKAPEIKISYSERNITNQNINVTITSNEKIQHVQGWILSDDELILTKTYSANTTETITVKDIAGNITTVQVQINNIDKIAPKVEISYSTTKPTNEVVTAIITANEKIQQIEGWTIDSTQRILTKVFTKNDEEILTITDLAGNTNTVNVKVINIDKSEIEANVEYSTTLLTNKDVTVMITINKEVKEIESWKLSEDRTKLTKIFTKNDEEEIELHDLAGNTKKIKIIVTNIDKVSPTVEVNYSITFATNKDVVATITANEEIKAIEGWSLSDNGKILTKTYSTNKKETITVQDIVGNTTQANIKITNIDKEKPKIEVTYSTIKPTKYDVIATITADKEIQEINGWVISSDKKSMTKTYHENTTETLIIKDLMGNSTDVTISIININQNANNESNNNLENIQNEQQTQDKDLTTVKVPLPQTGGNRIIISVVGIILVLLAGIFYINIRKYKDIN